MKPPLFDGTKVVDWCFKVDQYLNAVDPNSTDTEKFNFSINLLTGKALTWWRHEIAHGSSVINGYEALKHALYRQFVDIDLVNKLRD